MRAILESLLALQDLELSTKKSKPEAERARLRAKVPEPILAHFDRLVARGKKAVALVRQGVCAECHIRVPVGTLVTLAHNMDIQICGNCGRYLHLPEGESIGAAPKPASPRSKRVREQTTVRA
jgi:predicted  nucleic acid-binding Zn-ribbon protein